MSQKQNLLERFLQFPSDFRYQELKTLLGNYGYKETNGSGSRVKFVHEETRGVISLHKPHPGNIVKQYLLKQVAQKLKEDGYIE